MISVLVRGETALSSSGKGDAPAFAATLVIGYLSLTEFISILENMQNAGIDEAGALVEMARRKGGIGKSTGESPNEKGEK
nr:hypothetical protein [uncultured Selenomonas sp.]